jgi:hypothetical protein
MDTYTIYTISENGKVIYVGKTANDPRNRWTEHKVRARSLSKHARPLHYHMNTVSTDHKKFPEFLQQIITTTTDKQAAEDLEVAYIKAFQTHISGFNKYLGGGTKGKPVKSVRPLQLNNDTTTRNQSI